MKDCDQCGELASVSMGMLHLCRPCYEDWQAEVDEKEYEDWQAQREEDEAYDDEEAQ